MSALSEKVAAEHRRIWNNVWITCTCGWSNTYPPVGDRDVFLAHFAAMTEKAVRDAIARDIERLTPDVHGTGAFCAGMDRAARIAREGTTP